MKKVGNLSLFLFIIIGLTGCNTLSRKTMYTLDGKNISFTMPKIWEQVESNENDLALSKSTANLVLDTYYQSEVDDISATELLDQKVEEKMSEMDEYRLAKQYKTSELSDRKIYSVLYNGTKDGVESQYYFNVMEINNANIYVYALYSEKEIYMKYNIDDIQRMLIHMKWNGREDLAFN